MKHIVVYVHGKGGSAEEAEHYRPLFPDSEVVGFAYRAQAPWEAKEEFTHFFAEKRRRCDGLTLIANSIGAFFSMMSLDAAYVDRAYLISPVVDMEKLIGNMLLWANVTERELEGKAGDTDGLRRDALMALSLLWARAPGHMARAHPHPVR